MNIGHAQALNEQAALLVGLEAHVRQSLSTDSLLHLGETRTAADNEKDDARIVYELRGGREDGLELVYPSEVSGIGDDELVGQDPLPPQFIVRGIERHDGLAIGPIVNYLDVIARDIAVAYDALGHEIGDSDNAVGGEERAIPRAPQSRPT